MLVDGRIYCDINIWGRKTSNQTIYITNSYNNKRQSAVSKTNNTFIMRKMTDILLFTATYV